MSTAAITFVYNEAVNLPIWLRYYGGLFGEENLYVIDRESNDGSTSAEAMGRANRIAIPRDAFDDYKKTDFVSLLQEALLKYHRTVIYTDCDEIIVADPRKYKNLKEYVELSEAEWATCIGLNVLHMVHLEAPLDLSMPLLQQRRFALLLGSSCKTLISRVPIKWQPGFHSLDRRPNIDPNLFMFHTKVMDYGIAVKRHRINKETVWSEASLDAQHGNHHRYEQAEFVRQSFFDPVNLLNNNQAKSFDFSEEIAAFESETREVNGVYYVPMDLRRLVEIPDYLRTAF